MTATEIANGALGKQGIPTIDDIDSVSSEIAKNMKAALPNSRKLFLREAAPGIARKEVALALLSTESSEIYTQVYGYPADALKLRNIWNGTTQDYPKIEYEIGAHSSKTSKVILTNREEAIMIYTVDITNYNVYSSDDIEALEYLLAWKTAMINTRRTDLRDQLKLDFGIALAVAQKNNKREQNRNIPDFKRLKRARR